jgi:hypothetical protein
VPASAPFGAFAGEGNQPSPRRISMIEWQEEWIDKCIEALYKDYRLELLYSVGAASGTALLLESRSMDLFENIEGWFSNYPAIITAFGNLFATTKPGYQFDSEAAMERLIAEYRNSLEAVKPHIIEVFKEN